MGIETAIIGSALIGGGLNYLGAREQKKALKQAQATQAQSQAQALEFQKQIYEEGAPFRGLAREAIPSLREDLLAEPGTSALFQRGLTKGIENLATQYAKYGHTLGGSTEADTAVGEFTAGLAAQDIENIRARRMGLTGLQPAGVGGALQAGGLAQQAGAGVAQAQIGAGAVRGGLYGSLGQTIAGLPLQYAQIQGLQPGRFGPATTTYSPRQPYRPLG